MDYAGLMRGLKNEVLNSVQYKRMPQVYRVLMIILMIPHIVMFIASLVNYYVLLFAHKMLSAPKDYLQNWLKAEGSEVKHATQAVLYFLCIPIIWTFQIILALQAISFFCVWFLAMISAYIISLGGIRWQPFINEAKYDTVDEYMYYPSLESAKLFTLVLAGVTGTSLFMLMMNIIFRAAELFEVAGIFGIIYGVLWVIYLLITAVVTPIVFRKKKIEPIQYY